MSNGDYYSSDPVRIPRSPIAITGFSSTGYEAVARLVGAFTSLPLLHVSELVVHEAGRDGSAILAEDGPAAYADTLRKAVDRGLRSTPFGIVVVEARTLLFPKLAQRIASEAVLVAIRYTEEPEHSVELAQVLENAVVRVRGDVSPHHVANEIVAALQLSDEDLR